MGLSTYAPAEESSNKPMLPGDNSPTRWRPFDVALFVSTAVLALGLGIYAIVGGDLTAGVVAVTAVPAMGFLSRWAERFLEMQQVSRLAEQHHQDRMESQLQDQQARFEQMLTIDKRAAVVERVMHLLHRYNMADDTHRPGRGTEQLREISEAVYATLIYFDDPALIDAIIDAFVSIFRRKHVRVIRSMNMIADQFRQKLTETSRHIVRTGNPFTDLTTHLRKLNQAVFGLDSAIVPIPISKLTNYQQWNEVRFGTEVSLQAIEQLMSTGRSKSYLRNVDRGDVLIFWRDRDYDDDDGVVGMIWVESADMKKQALHFGKRVTVSLDRMVRFHKIDSHELESGAVPLNVTDDITTKGTANAGKLRGGIVRPWSAFERMLRNDYRILPESLDYAAGFTLGMIIDQLESRQSPLAPINGMMIDGTIFNMREESLRIEIDYSTFLADDRSERLLEELVERDKGNVRLQYREYRWDINTITPSGPSRLGGGEAATRNKVTSFSFKPIGAPKNTGKVDGTHPVKLKFSISDDDLAIEILDEVNPGSGTSV